MTGKKASIGFLVAVPSPKSGVVVSAGSKRGRTESFEAENTTKTLYKSHGGGGCSSKMTQSHKAGEFVDKRSGNKGFKEEVMCKSSVKFDDKFEGCTTEYEAQVKFKKVTTFNSNNSSKKARVAAAPKPSASYKRISYDHCDYYDYY